MRLREKLANALVENSVNNGWESARYIIPWDELTKDQKDAAFFQAFLQADVVIKVIREHLVSIKVIRERLDE
tara:strand:+ start:19478 stop:19693 length:216 start_codon:yes stop_codon:yes gene_type:complete